MCLKLLSAGIFLASGSLVAGETALQPAALAFLKKNCFECHGEKTKKAGVDLLSYKDEVSLLKDAKVWKAVLEQVQTDEMPPEKKPRPDKAEKDAFLSYVKDVFKRAEANPDPGRVTIRRLNRVEYNNTIRDLLAVDFEPAEDFPSDEVGYGFDNIGDVLSLSPVLMERYVAAAEQIMQRSLVVEAPKPVKRWQSSKHVEPGGKYESKFRAITTKPGAKGPETGPLFQSYKVPGDGEYIFRTRVYATAPEGKTVKFAILANGAVSANSVSDADIGKFHGNVANMKPFTVLKTVEVKAREEKKAENFEVKVPAMGINRIAIALMKPEEGTLDTSLHVEYFQLEGPLDPRPAYHRKLCAPGETPDKAKTRTILSDFASRAYRRPATEKEIDGLAKLVDSVVTGGDKWEAGLQIALQAVLCSPKFLFRVELDDRPDQKEPRPLDEFQLASRLSYFLWSSMPDDQLIELAKKKELSANIDAQIKRMLQDPKAFALVENFGIQWLQIKRLNGHAPDSKVYASFNERLRRAFFKETELFLQAVIKEDRSILDLIAADFTFMNESLAQHYGYSDTNGNRTGQKAKYSAGKPLKGNDFQRVTIPDGERGGLLTQGSILTVTSNPTRTSPVKRGRWVLDQILGTPPPPPPPDIPDLPDAKGGELKGTLRQRMEQHRENPSCANCHARMDPIGFAFENFDGVGKFRFKDGTADIDTSGVLPDGRAFKGPQELKAILKEKKDLFSYCLAEKLLTYALGRGLKYYDEPALRKIVAELDKKDYRFSVLVSEIVKSDPFRMKRGTGQGE